MIQLMLYLKLGDQQNSLFYYFFVFFFGKVRHLIPLSGKFALKWVTEHKEVELTQIISCHFVHPCYLSIAMPFCFKNEELTF